MRVFEVDLQCVHCQSKLTDILCYRDKMAKGHNVTVGTSSEMEKMSLGCFVGGRFVKASFNIFKSFF
jgi:hypothetical protein